MLFRRIVLCALLVGALSGLLLSAVQRWQAIPLINSAERLEQTPMPAATDHGHHSHAEAMTQAAHEHAAAEWAPEEGVERSAYTVLANVLTATGFALLLLVGLVVAFRRNAATQLDWRHGMLWGAAGYATFFVAPALGLPPEIPGAAAAPLEARQLWWVFAAACTGAGLAGAAFGKAPWRWAALGLLALPHLMGAPHLDTGPFDAHPPAQAAVLTELARQFLWATVLANAIFWLALGSASGWAARRFLKQAIAAE